MNILVCDDDREIAEAIEIHLKIEGHTVFLAFDGLEALAVAAREDIHLAILDVMMPNMDG
ncbi:MAG: response regulator, partial [Clostridiales Family XIII bacterium]|nr:response regulator [Clostridiales Family XIII bacterium]